MATATVVTADTIVEVNGLIIKSDSTYKITPKPDSDAPSGFVKEGTTKLPSMGIGNSVPCRYVITNKATGQGVYDTGLYEQSPCYSTMNQEEVKLLVERLQEKIVIPYEKSHGKGILDQSNTEFWDNYVVDLEAGRYFSTSSIDDLLGLYIAMRGYELTPRDSMGDSKYNDSQFCIEDKAEVKNIKDRRAENIMRALTNFGNLLQTNRPTLINMLKYVQMLGITNEVDDTTLNTVFYEYVQKSETNVKRFLDTLDLVEKDKGELVNLYAHLTVLARKGMLQKEGAMYMFNGVELGADLKTAAKNLGNKKLSKTKIAILELDTE